MSVKHGQCKSILPSLIYQQPKCAAMKRRRNLTLKLISAGLIFFLLLRTGVIHMLVSNIGRQSHRAHTGGKSFIRQVVDTQQKSENHRNLHSSVEDSCSVPYLKKPLRIGSHTPALCRRQKPRESSCSIAQELFQLKSIGGAHTRCKHQDGRDFCRLETSRDKYTVSCDHHTCDGQFGLVTLNIVTGDLEFRPFVNATVLEREIGSILVKPNAGFCYVLCLYGDSAVDDVMDEGLVYDIETYGATQILNLPPIFSTNNQNTLYSQANHDNQPINLNLILIDSVSRQHFFRSLPETVNLLGGMYSSEEPYYFPSNTSVVLDFELFQAVRSRTFESLQALFSGYINPFEKTFGMLAMPPNPLNTGKLLKPLKYLGYKTLWLEDLCYFWEWGMSKDLLVHNKELSKQQTWRNLINALQNASIDSMGMSPASCEILRTNGVDDPFHGPANLCYNGRHEHEYYLEYLRMYQTHLDSHYQPYFTFMETNIGHEGTGIRIQALDQDFVEYLTFLKTQKNTLTILFSDHGNSYGKFVSNSEEGTLETFHPFLYMIIPENVQKFIGEAKMYSLIENQQRLVSLLDVHYMLASVIDITHSLHSSHQKTHLRYSNVSTVTKFNKQFNVSSLGLFGKISDSRTCSSIPRIVPNLCLCEGFEESPVLNKYYRTMAGFAVSELNKEIGRQRENGKIRALPSCQQLRLTEVLDIKESRNSDGSKSVKMELKVHVKKQVATMDAEIFNIALHVPSTDGQGRRSEHAEGRQPSIVRFERLTSYSRFRVCADPNVDLELCVCNLNLAVIRDN